MQIFFLHVFFNKYNINKITEPNKVEPKSERLDMTVPATTTTTTTTTASYIAPNDFNALLTAHGFLVIELQLASSYCGQL